MMEALIFNLQKFSLHDGSGIRTNVFFQGCNLRCKWCANPESMEIAHDLTHGKAKRYTLCELMAELIKDKPFYDASGGGVTLTGGEPLLQYEFVLALCDALHAADIRVNLETAANVSPDIFRRVALKCDAILADLKHYDPSAHKRGCGVDNALTIENIRYALQAGVHTIIRIPIIPAFNNSARDMREFVRLLGNIGVREVHLLPFHQLGESKYNDLNIDYAYAGIPQLHSEDMEPLAEILRKNGLQVQIGG